MMFVDCHWHLTEYDEDRIEAKISKANKVGVGKGIGVPFDLESSRSLIKLSERFEELYPTAGIHPKNSPEVSERKIEKTIDLIDREEVVAVGEIGVDLHFMDEDTKEDQLRVFRKLLDAAIDNDLPVIFHCPRGEPATFEEIRDRGVENAIFHWYTGPISILREILDTERYYISVTPAVTYSGKIQKVVDVADLGKIVLESDGPADYRSLGKGEPAHIPKVAEKIGEIKGIDREIVENKTSENAEKIF